MIKMPIEEKIERLKKYLENKKSVLAFSAGSDSTLIANILSQVSPDSMLATIDNNMMPPEFIEYTKKQAKNFNLTHKIIKLNYLTDPTFQNNTKERCYECRKLMYQNIHQLPEFDRYDYFLEGTNITDLLENRPGTMVLEKYNMTSPLVECNITKEDVLEMIKYFDLEYSPDTTCLATRIKTNQKVDAQKLEKIHQAEKYVRTNVDQENIRVRTDNETATISVDEPLKILDEKLLQKLRNKIQELGFKKVSLDITGYEKTQLTPSTDKDGNYYYQLPYTINLDETKENLTKRTYLTGKITMDENLHYNDITIQENGRIHMPPTGEFKEKFHQILGSIKRKKI